MTFKMAVFDVDGTLYDLDEHIVPESCKEALVQMKNNGILFSIATGRAHYGLGKAINDLHADYILAANGGVVVDKNKTILSHCDMTLQECEDLLDFAHKTDAGLVFKFPDHVHFPVPRKDRLARRTNELGYRQRAVHLSNRTNTSSQRTATKCMHSR